MRQDKIEEKRRKNDHLMSTLLIIFLAFIGSLLSLKGDVIQDFITHDLKPDIYNLEFFQLIGLLFLSLSATFYVIYLIRYQIITKNRKLNACVFLVILPILYVIFIIVFDLPTPGILDQFAIWPFIFAVSALLFFLSYHIAHKLRGVFDQSEPSKNAALVISIFSLLLSSLGILFW